MSLIDRFIKDEDKYEIPPDDDLGTDINVSTSSSYGNLEDAQIMVDEKIKSDNNRYEKIADKINDKGMMQTSSADGLNKEDNPLVYYIKKTEQMDATIKLFSAKVETIERSNFKRQKEWQKMKAVNFDMQTLVRNIEQGLGGGDISSNDINEIVNRVLSRINKKLDVREKKTQLKNKEKANKKISTKTTIIKYGIFGIILLSFIATVVFSFSFFSGANNNNTKESIKGLSITRTVNSNSIVYCKPKKGGKYAKYKIGEHLIDVKGKLDTNNNFYFTYKSLFCKANSKDLS